MEWLKRPHTFAEQLSRSAKVGSHSRPWCMRSHGAFGEKMAEGFLKRNGYKILKRRFLCRFGELDIVAQDKSTIAFVEVKQRSSSEFGMPYEAVDKTKRRKIINSAMAFVKRYGLEDYDLRFDIVSILSEPASGVNLAGEAGSCEAPQIELIKGAFEMEEERCWRR